MTDIDDAQVRRAIAGDIDALSGLLQIVGPQLRQQLSIDKRWQAVLDPDDVLQVTYLEAFLQIGRFTPGGPKAFLGWLKRIAENNLRDAIKGLEAAKRPPPELALQNSPPEQSMVALFELLHATSATPSRVAAIGEMQSALTQALGQLPPDYAQVIREYDLNGRPIAEVAKKIGRTAGAVHMLRARAHDQLRDSLGSPSRYFSTPA